MRNYIQPRGKVICAYCDYCELWNGSCPRNDRQERAGGRLTSTGVGLQKIRMTSQHMNHSKVSCTS